MYTMIVGFDFSKIVVHREAPLKRGIRVGNNLTISSVNRKDFSSLGAGKKGIAVEFSYQVSYEPKVGSLTLEGTLLYMGDEKKIDDILSQWERSKQLPDDVSLAVLNLILARCNVKALQLANDVGLPPQMQLPQVTANSIE